MTQPRTLADYRAALAEAQRENTRLKAAGKDLEEFKQRVAQKAYSLKSEHGWCEVVDDALAELGIKPATHQVEVTVNFTFANAFCRRGDIESADFGQFVWNSVTNLERVGLDRDWENDEADVTVEGVKIDGKNLDLDTD